MKKRVLVLTAVMLVSAFVFAACQQAAPTQAAAQAEEAALAEEAAPAEEAAALSGQLQIAGSTTVQPLAEELAAEFMAANPDVSIDIQGGGSSVGVTSAGDSTVDLGAASREVKDSEFETYPDLQVITIAYDGIAIVVNPDVALDNLTKDQVQAIFAGEVTNFSEVGGPDAPITVVSREEGSGTRAAFEELVMEYKDDAGEKQVKPIVESALLQQSNGQVRTVVSTTPNTIAYLSFGFLDDSVKGVPVDGVEPTVVNVKNGSYSIFRPLNLLSNGAPSALAQAFLDYILSDGQSIVAEDYITVTEEETVEEAAPAAALSGQMQMAGSTTVQPLAEELAAAFMDANADVSIDIQGGGSSVGVTSAGDGTVDLGAASREIKDSEFEAYPDLQVFTIAYDGIAIVVNPDVALDSLTKDQVQAIFAGEVTNFSEVGGPDAPITVVSREEGSGTRAAFEELVMEYKDDAGEKQVKPIAETALLQQSNGQVRTVVSTTPNTIAFLSFGFLDDSVKGVAIDSVEPTVDNVKNGSYSIFRPLNLLSNGQPSELAQAFLDYILSDGQSIVAEDYITVTD